MAQIPTDHKGLRSSLVAAALVLLVVLFPVNAGAIQGAGASATLWWIVGGLLFGVPSTAVILALARQEGNPFLALRRAGAWGHAGSLGIWVAGTLAVVSASTATLSYLERALGSEIPTVVEGVAAVVIALLATLAWRIRAWNLVIIVGAVALLIVIVIAFVALLSNVTEPVAGAAASASASASGAASWSWLGLVVLGLVGVHEPLQRRALFPVRTRVLWWALGLVLVGYLILTLAFAYAVPMEQATTFTSLADLGGVLGGSTATLVAVLIAVSFTATALGTGSVFRELQNTLSMRKYSSVTLIAIAGIATFVLVPLIFEDSTAGVVYAVLQGATALLWTLGYVIMGVVVLRRSPGTALRIAAVLTVALGAIGAIGVLATSFSATLTGMGWTVSVIVLAAVALALVWSLNYKRGASLSDA